MPEKLSKEKIKEYLLEKFVPEYLDDIADMCKAEIKTITMDESLEECFILSPLEGSTLFNNLSIGEISVEAIPAIKVDDIYQSYIDSSANIEDVLKQMADCIKSAIQNVSSFTCEQIANLDDIKANIYACLIDTYELGSEINNVPHYNMADLTVIYKLVYENDEGKIINNEFMNQINMAPEDLYEISINNMYDYYRPSLYVYTIKNFIDQDFINDDGVIEIIKLQNCMKSIEGYPFLKIFDNASQFGSSILLNEGYLNDVVSSFSSNAIIIAPTISEIYITPITTPVSEINRFVKKYYNKSASFLSNSLYKYDFYARNLQLLSI